MRSLESAFCTATHTVRRRWVDDGGWEGGGGTGRGGEARCQLGRAAHTQSRFSPAPLPRHSRLTSMRCRYSRANTAHSHRSRDDRKESGAGGE
jgi:hypothetical protein